VVHAHLKQLLGPMGLDLSFMGNTTVRMFKYHAFQVRRDRNGADRFNHTFFWERESEFVPPDRRIADAWESTPSRSKS